MRTIFTTILLLFFVVQGIAQTDQLTIQNKYLRVTFNKRANSFAFESLPSGKTFATTRNLYLSGKEVVKNKYSVKILGSGEALEIRGNQGGKIYLLPNVPFVFIQGKIKNDSITAKVVNRIPLASFGLSLPVGPDKLKAMGTGGLQPLSKCDGSYAWLGIANPENNQGAVFGWITHERASGLLFPEIINGEAVVNARSDYGRLRLAAGSTEETEVLAVGYFDDARIGLENWADLVAKANNIKLHQVPTGFCTWYCEKHGRAADEQSLAQLTDFTEKNLKPWGFNFIQIDDFWQDGDAKKNGPNKNFTRVKATGPYPSGMKQTADYIKSKGFTPGIWFMPFAGTYNDPWFTDHQEWFAKRADGKPYDTPWGGTCFDMTYGPARDYLAGYVKQMSKEWGYTYFKMDGLSTGLAVNPRYVNAGYREDDFGDAVFSNPDQTNFDAYRSGLRLVREAAGPDVFFLGCCAAQNMRSYQGSFGLVDAMRIGPDNGGSWKGWLKASPDYGTRHYFINGRIWWNDPDPNYLRSSVTLDEARSMATFAAISGTLNSNSDWIPDLSAERIEVLKRTMLVHHATARPVDFFRNPVPAFWQITDYKAVRRDLVAVFNWKDTITVMSIPVSKLQLPAGKHYAAYEFWSNSYLPEITDTIKVTLPKHTCAVISLRPVGDRPFVISTSQHVTQGIIDLSDELWNPVSKTLSGKSKVVANDPYELRVFIPKTAKLLNIAKVTSNHGATIKVKQTARGAVVTIVSPRSEEVNWKMVF